MAKIKMLIMCLLLLSEYAFTQTQIAAGPVSGTWNDPHYQVNGDIYISSGSSLNIAAGTLIEFVSTSTLTVYGEISAIGYQSGEIMFTGVPPHDGWGGIIIQNNDEENVFEYCIFEKVLYGYGAVYLNAVSNTIFSECIFRENEVNHHGAALTCISSLFDVYACDFSANSVQQNDGGAIYIDAALENSQIVSCMFEDNHAGRGGAIFVKDCDDIIIENNFIQANQATNSGGGLYIEGSAISNFRNNDFFSNVAYYSDGGAIYSDASIMTIRLSKFRENSADDQGGGIYISGIYQGGDYFSLINCQITGNMTNSDGGGIYSDCFFYSASNTISDNNARFGSGGGIFHDGCTSQIVNTIIYNNTAGQNSNAFPYPDGNNGYSYSCVTPITNCPTCISTNPGFISSGNYMISKTSPCCDNGNNNAPHENEDLLGNNRIVNSIIDIRAFEHPYLYLCGSVNGRLLDHNPNGIDYIVDCDIYISLNNTLEIDHGTEIAFDDGVSLDVDGSISAIGEANAYITFTASDPDDGWAGIRFDDVNPSESAEFEYCIFEYGKKTNDCGCSVFSSEYNGGAIFIQDYSNVTISNSIFRYNVASRGGAIYVRSTTNDIISPTIGEDNAFENNEACKGGAICLQGDDSETYTFKLQANISNNTFTDNFSDYYGGAIFADIFDNSEIVNNTFVDNSSNSKGGALNICGGSITLVEKNAISSNTSIYGGGICINYGQGFQGTDPQILLNTISSNVADYGGGIAFINPPNGSTNNTQVEGNLIVENEAGDGSGGKGGGIYIQDFDPYIVNNTIADNIADDGAGVYADANSNPEFWNTIIYFNDDWSSSNEDIGGSLPTDNASDFYKNCDIRDMTNTNSSYNSDPDFSTLGNGYHTKYSSLICIDNGSNGASLLSGTDMDGVNWGYGSGIDIGCYENDNSYYFIVFNDLDEKEEQKPSSSKEKEFNIVLYPNPATNSTFLVYMGEKGLVTVHIIDIAGKNISSFNFDGKENEVKIDVSGFLPGIYFVIIFNTDKSMNKTLKLIKH